ncbi:hypothetical protein, partial [Pedobacter namyangjuensis]|uniref:hypothetical protein n=1 Tax=Pedobacter namyangjuensis TaxID=600626 RepID=UPI00196536DA
MSPGGKERKNNDYVITNSKCKTAHKVSHYHVVLLNTNKNNYKSMKKRTVAHAAKSGKTIIERLNPCP